MKSIKLEETEKWYLKNDSKYVKFKECFQEKTKDEIIILLYLTAEKLDNIQYEIDNLNSLIGGLK